MIEILNSENKPLISAAFKDFFFIFLKEGNKYIKNHFLFFLDVFMQLNYTFRETNDLNYNNMGEEKIEIKDSFLDLEENKVKNNINKNELNEENNNYLNLFVYMANFLQSYSKELNNILALYDILYTVNFADSKKLKTIIYNIKIRIESKEFKQSPNKCFVYIIEVLSKIFNKNISEVISRINDKYRNKDQIIKYCQFFIQNILRLEKRFSLIFIRHKG